MSEREQPILVSDFDGTMTERDFYRIALAELVPAGTPDYWDDYLAGRITHFEALRLIFSHVHADEATIMHAAEAMGVDAGLAGAVTRLQARGWEIVVASAGCAWYIERLLAARGVRITVHANPGELAAGDGLAMRLPVESPYYTPTTGIDKEAVVRDAVQTHACVAFAGDGIPDRPAAMLVPPERRFARGWLADALHADGVPFRAFTRWSEIAEMLLEDSRC